MFNLTPEKLPDLACIVGDVAINRDNAGEEAAVGDVQDVLAAAVALMTAEQLAALIADHRTQFVLEQGYGLEIAGIVETA